LKTHQFNDTQMACGTLLLAVAEANERLETVEYSAIQDILSDFLHLSPTETQELLEVCKDQRKLITGLFESGKILNHTFDLETKLDFIHCIYEVGYSDGSLHHLEDFIIKRIANILHIEQADLIDARIEVRRWFAD